MGEQKKNTLHLESSRRSLSPGGASDFDSTFQPNGLTPIVIVVYLVGYWLWVNIGPRAWVVFGEPYDCIFLLVVAVVLSCSGRRDEIRKYFLGRLVPRSSDVPQAALVTLVLSVWLVVANLLQWHWFDELEPAGALRAVRGVVTIPITEEIACRGIILAILLRYTESGRWMALLISAFLFAGIHVVQDIYHLVVLLGAGVLLGYGYMATKSVPFCILCHSICNGLVYLAVWAVNKSD